MADIVLTDAKVFLGEHDITGQTNAVSLQLARELVDATTFGSGGVRERAAGLRTVALQVEGKTDGSTVDAALADGLGVADVPVSVIPIPTVGEVAYFFRCVEGDYQPLGNTVGELARFSAGAELSNGRCIRGVLMINIADAAESADGTAVELAAVGADESLYAALHVFSASEGDTLDVIVEGDSEEAFGDDPTTRITFDQVSAVGSQWKSAAGAIADTWYRVSFTIAGTSPEFSFAVVLGIAPTAGG